MRTKKSQDLTKHNNAINHFKKLIDSDDFVVTGSYSLFRIGLLKKVGDLDIIAVNMTSESESVIEKISEDNDYPNCTDTRYRVLYDDLKVDILLMNTPIEKIELADGISIAKPTHIVSYKKKYNRLKDILQLKKISEIFYKRSDLATFIEEQQSKI